MQRLYGKSLFFFLNFAVNLKLLFKTKAVFFKKQEKNVISMKDAT